MAQSTAIFGGGCFWCTEAVFQEVRGVSKVESGYTGGTKANPSYDEVCSGATGHAEVIKVTYDPAIVSYRSLIEIFMGSHDPTTKDRQGADVGTQYRSIICYDTEEEKQIAVSVIAEMDAMQVFPASIVTRVEKLGTFYPAEPYHQNYYRDNESQPYCLFVINPKLAKFREKYKSLLRSGS